MFEELEMLSLENIYLEKEWVISIQTPESGVKSLVFALGKNIPLRQGNYDHCVFISALGKQQFRALEGSHAGDEKTIQSTDTTEVQIAIKPNITTLKQVMGLIFEFHVHEEPTFRIFEVWASRSKYKADKDNPNKYWNRSDSHKIHGKSITSVEEKSE